MKQIAVVRPAVDVPRQCAVTDALSVLLAAPLPQLLDVAARQARALLGGELAVANAVVDGVLTVRAVDQTESMDVHIGQEVPREAVLVRHVMVTGRPYLCHDPRSDPLVPVQGATRLGYRSSVTVPFAVDDGPLAVLQVCSRESHVYTTADVEVLRQLCLLLTARLRAGRGVGGDEVLRAALMSSLDEGVTINRGSDLREEMTNPVMDRMFGHRPGATNGRPIQPEGWSWFALDGTPIAGEDLPMQVAQRTGRPVLRQTVRVLPAGVDPTSSQGRAATRWVSITALPMTHPVTGAVELVTTRIRDVTDQRQSEVAQPHESPLERTLQLVNGMAWWTFDAGNGTFIGSEELYRIAGLDPHGPRAGGQHVVAMIDPQDMKLLGRLARNDGRTPPTGEFNHRMTRVDGQVRHIHGWYSRIVAADGTARLSGVSLDVTDRERALARVEERGYQLERAFDGTPYGSLLVSLAPDSIGSIRRANRALASLLEVPLGTLTGQVSQLLASPPEDRVPALDVDLLLDLARTDGRLVRRLVREGRPSIHVWVTATAVDDVQQDEPFLVVHVLDVTSERLQQEALQRIAHSDGLTKLANRMRATLLLDELTSTPQRAPLAVLLLDLDRFKSVNDRLGHQFGDLLLIEVARRLEELVPGGGLAARLGGDEFVLIVPGLDEEGAAALAQAVVERLRVPVELPEGHHVVTGASVGVAMSGSGRTSRGQLLRDADLALYRAKDRGRNQFVLCDEDLRAGVRRRVELEQRMRRALEEDGMSLRLQPIFKMGEERPFSFEALARMTDPEVGLISPVDFIPLAEETGLIASIDHWVIDQVVALQRVATAAGDEVPRIAFNVSAHTLERVDFVPRMRERLADGDLDPRMLCLEVTESCLMDDTGTALATLRELRSLGMVLAIDDFGTGYSALSYLQNFDFQVLKVDRSFVADLSAANPRARARVAAIIDLAHAHDMRVVAEGIETPEQLELLGELGCDFGQGYLYAAPGTWRKLPE